MSFQLRNAASRLGGSTRASLVLVSLLVSSGAFAEAADEPAALSKEERTRLEKQALELNSKGVDLYEAGRYAEATALQTQALALMRQLYPAQQHPQDHRGLATILNNLGGCLKAQKEYGKARGYLEEALAMNQRLYPAKQFPQGHPELARSLTDLGVLLKEQGEYARALPYHEQALAMNRRLYPDNRFPQGHPTLAISLTNLGALLWAQGEHDKALTYLEQALRMRQRLFPASQYPQGHPALARSLNGMGVVLEAQGDFDKARAYYEQAVAMRRQLYSAPQYPQGHPDLADSLNLLGVVLHAQQEYAKALTYLEQALRMRQRLFPTSQYPQGHPALAQSLQNLGALLQVQGENAKALGYLEQALAMNQRLYPVKQFPQGHSHLATCLDSLGGLWREQGEYGKAQACYQQALAMQQRLFPIKDFPQGHPALASTLNNLGALLDDQGQYHQAQAYFEQALAMNRRLYPAQRFPQGHPRVAVSLMQLGGLLQEQGEYGKARAYLEQALAMSQQLYSAGRFPGGHPILARSFNDLGVLLHEQGEFGKAQAYLERAWAMRQQLYPAQQYPRGHPDLAQSLNNLGALLRAQGEFGKARTYVEQALATYQKLYPSELFPQGHHDLADTLNSLGALLRTQGEYDKAQVNYEQALAMYRQLYPARLFPQGHPGLAITLDNLGSLFQTQNEYGKAQAYYEQALAMNQQLYPAKLFPQGHPDLAGSLSNLGFVLQAQGESGKALEHAEAAIAMYQTLFRAFGASGAESELFNFLARFPEAEHILLSASRHLELPPERVYRHLWNSKAAVGRLLERRQAALVRVDDPAPQQLALQLRDSRRHLARLLLSPSAAGPAHAKRLQAAIDAKDHLERQLAACVPALRRLQELERLGPADLAQRLPPRTVFIDLFPYFQFGKRGDPEVVSYVAFVLRRGEPVQRVELGPAEPINKALAGWRREIVAAGGRPSEAPALLRKLLWAPLARHVPTDTETVWLAPDGPLTALPWAALPGRKAGTILLEDHAVALVPHGPFLLDRLTPDPERRPATGKLLTVGGVDYDQPPQPVAVADLALRGAAQTAKRVVWKPLPATAREQERIRELARETNRPVLPARQGRAASAAQVLLDLPQARWAHFATHGFFADAAFRSYLQVDEEQFERTGRHRGTAGARSPLVLSGLVLAGANRPEQEGDRGILTAEGIASLPLQDLELAVLSACDTGRGEVAGGEGVFGLQRAFHLAGTQNVIASLWEVDDQATAALMGLFYRKLWLDKQPPLEALREAQLYLYRHPEQIAVLAQRRGADFANPKPLPSTPPRTGVATGPGKHAAVSQWAAFVLSGAGQ